MTLAEAQVSPFRNIITRSVGTAASLEADIFAQALAVGDTLLLCSDGLSGHLEASEMQAITEQHSPSVAALSLVEAANERGGRDNITALVLSVRALLPYEGGEAAFDDQSPGKEAQSKDEKPSRWGRRK